jgi:formate hydrogenlyase subunit 6/NADH:ubiquinone oxidoreductase subunit I
MMYSLNWNSPCVACALCGRTCYSVIQWVATAYVVLCTSS